jgi:8-oxo-dGTP pyrophosphatase MutT (NUDIX family)
VLDECYSISMKINEKIWNIVYRYSSKGLEILILKPNPEPGRNTDYYVITGGVEVNEQPVEAAKRETHEEVGISPINIVDLHKTIFYTDKYSKIEYVEHCFAIEIGDTPPTLNEEHIEYKWVTLDTFANSIWWEGDKTKLNEIIEAFSKVIAKH